jgi:hypothetical protein
MLLSSTTGAGMIVWLVPPVPRNGPYVMTRADIERLSREYGTSGPRDGPLARALQVDIPVWRQLGDEIFSDLDEQVFGAGWCAPGPGTSRRVLISDHLYACVRSVERDLIEARLHFIEAMDFRERAGVTSSLGLSPSARTGTLESGCPTLSDPWTRSRRQWGFFIASASSERSLAP